MIFVAPRATEEFLPSHFYAFYSRLFSIGEFEGKKISIVSSSRGSNSVDKCNYKYILTSRYTKDNFSGPKNLDSFKSDQKKIFELCNSNSEIHFYDGNFREFLLLFRCHLEESTFFSSFNFQNANEWLSLLKSEKIIARIMRYLMKKSIQNFSNTKFYAESSNLSDVVNNVLEIQSTAFPVVTNLPRVTVEKVNRFDVLFMPQSQDEFTKCFEMARKLKTDFNFSFLKIAIRVSSQLDVSTSNNSEQIVVIDAELNLDDYIELLTGTKVVVLPYFQNFYRWGSSGKYLDSIYLKCVTIVPDSSRMSKDGNIYGYTFPYRCFVFEEVSELIRQALDYSPTGDEEEVLDSEKMLKILSSESTTSPRKLVQISNFRLKALFWLLSFTYVFYLSENQSKKAIMLSFIYNRARQIYRSTKSLGKILHVYKRN